MLTAGLGTRLRPVTEYFAKPVVPFLNVPLMCYPLPLIEDLKITSLVFNTHYKPEQVVAVAEKVFAAKHSISFSNESVAPLGSAGGIRHARKLLEGDGHFLVVNGDEVILPREPEVMRRFHADHLTSGALVSILVMPHPLVGSQFGGVWSDQTGKVYGFGKTPPSVSSKGTHVPLLTGHHYVGVLLVSDRVFQHIPEGESNIFYDVLTAAIAKGELVRTFSSSFTWYETGNSTDFLNHSGVALRLLSHGQGPDADALKSICHRFWPGGTKLAKSDHGAIVLASPSAEIDKSASVRGFAVVGDGARIEAGAEIDGVVVLPGARASGRHANEMILASP